MQVTLMYGVGTGRLRTKKRHGTIYEVISLIVCCDHSNRTLKVSVETRYKGIKCCHECFLKAFICSMNTYWRFFRDKIPTSTLERHLEMAE